MRIYCVCVCVFVCKPKYQCNTKQTKKKIKIKKKSYPEFVFSSYDGYIHCYSFLSNKTIRDAGEPYSWPYKVTTQC